MFYLSCVNDVCHWMLCDQTCPVINVTSHQGFCGQANQKQLSVESLQSYIDVMVRQIRDSHEAKEEALEKRIRELKATVRDMVQKNEGLSSAYRFVQFCMQEKP